LDRSAIEYRTKPKSRVIPQLQRGDASRNLLLDEDSLMILNICDPAKGGTRKGGGKCFYTIAIALIVLWLLGLVSSYTMGGFIHLLLVMAIVIVVINLIPVRKPVP